MNKFKVGDRAALYGVCGRSVGRIESIVSRGLYAFLVDGKTYTFPVHEKQLRRLRPKTEVEPHTIFVNEYPNVYDTWKVHFTEQDALVAKTSGCVATHEYRRVRVVKIGGME